jgi:hypothetical protein
VPNGRSDKGSKKTWKEKIANPDPLPRNLPDLVFVVQFREPTEARSARFAGRAEHVMSGQNTGFERPEELIAFFGRVMNQLKTKSRIRKGITQ